MTRRTTETFHGFDQPEILVTLPDDHDHPRRTPRPPPRDVGVQLLGWLPATQLRRHADLTGDDDLVEPGNDTVVPFPQRDT